VLLWLRLLFGGLLRQSAWLLAFVGAHLFWQFRPDVALEASGGWTIIEWLTRPLLLVVALATAFAGVGRGIVLLSALRRGLGVDGTLCAARRVGPVLSGQALYNLSYVFQLPDGQRRRAAIWRLWPVDAEHASRAQLLALADPPHTAVATEALPAAVLLDAVGAVRARRPWLGLLSLGIPLLVIFQNRMFLLQSHSWRARVLMAGVLVVFGLLPALWVVARAASRLERRDDDAVPSS